MTDVTTIGGNADNPFLANGGAIRYWAKRDPFEVWDSLEDARYYPRFTHAEQSHEIPHYFIVGIVDDEGVYEDFQVIDVARRRVVDHEEWNFIHPSEKLDLPLLWGEPIKRT